MCLFKRLSRRKAGHSAVETALMLPWLIFSFMGTLDFGFATYSLISLQSAALVAAVYASANSAVANDPTVWPSTAGTTRGSDVAISASFSFQALLPMLTMAGSSTIGSETFADTSKQMVLF